MYLYKTASSNYDTRICLPNCFRDRGFPFALKVSLLTKNRQLASLRNLYVAIELKRLIDGITPQTHPTNFKIAAKDLINRLRSTFVEELDVTSTVVIPFRPTNPE